MSAEAAATKTVAPLPVAAPEPAITTTESAFTPIITNNSGNSNNSSSIGNNNNSRGNNPNGAPYSSFVAGGFIYVILVGAILVALVYFGRSILAKRRERIRRGKDPDYEGKWMLSLPCLYLYSSKKKQQVALVTTYSSSVLYILFKKTYPNK